MNAGGIAQTQAALNSAPGKQPAIQLLRALAAGVVAALHIAYAFADHLPPGLGLPADSGAAGQGAVMVFFVISGYVMVLSARRQPRSPVRFWLRRAIRILPAYWLATLALALVFLTVQPQPIALPDLLRSLVLLPYWPPDGSLRPVPFLWVGWTLFYELVFYAIFGLFAGRGPVAGPGWTAAVLIALAAAGQAVLPVNAPLFALTRPVLLMFVAGMALAAWRETGGCAPGWARLAALAAMGAAAWLVPPPPENGAMGLDYLAWCGVPALLLAFAALGGPLPLPRPRAIVAAGDMSYALYLLHVPVAWAWLWLWGGLPFFDAGPLDYLASCCAASLIAAALFHRRIERPLTRALNRLAGTPHGRDPSR